MCFEVVLVVKMLVVMIMTVMLTSMIAMMTTTNHQTASQELSSLCSPRTLALAVDAVGAWARDAQGLRGASGKDFRRAVHPIVMHIVASTRARGVSSGVPAAAAQVLASAASSSSAAAASASSPLLIDAASLSLSNRISASFRARNWPEGFHSLHRPPPHPLLNHCFKSNSMNSKPYILKPSTLNHKP